MEWLFEARWSPYAAGAGIGLLSWLTFLLSDKPIGCSSAFSRTAGMIEIKLRGDKAASKPYYRQFPPALDWEWMLVLGIFIGAFVSAAISGDFRWVWTPDVWAAAFGPAPVPRLIVALAGGVFLGFGARWAGGCTSGHGISGTMQLAASSWVAALSFFAGGIAAAWLIFRVLG